MGSVYESTLVIAGSNLPALFGRLGELSYGDEVVFTDVDGNEFSYSVVTVETIASERIDDAVQPSDTWDLTLFTSTFSAQSQTVVRLSAAD